MADLSSTPLVQHYVDTDNAKPILQRAYCTSHHHCQEIEKEVEGMLCNGIIEPSVSPWASPIVVDTKADNTLWLCIDYQTLNKASIKGSYPLPHIQDTLDTLYGKNLFTTLDLLKEYHQIKAEENSCEKKAFTTHIGLFQYILLPFGLTNVPASFQHLLEHVLRDYIGKFVILYIGDVLIFSASFADHLSHVAQVMHTLWEAYLKVRMNKCQFARKSVEFLGHLIISEGIGPNKRNVEAVTSFPTPANIKDVRAFLGLCNYYWQFIKNYSVLAGPLLQLLKENTVFHWHSLQHESFLGLKERLTTAPILAYPDFSIPFTLYTDASGDSIGFNLTQVQHGKKEPLFMVEGTFQTRRKSTPSQNEKHC